MPVPRRREPQVRRRTSPAAGAAVEMLESRMLLATAELVKDINTDNSLPTAPTWLTDVNGTVFFNGHQKLYRSDGTDAGTALVTDRVSSPAHLANVDGTLFFASQSRLWKSDGTDAGTVQVLSASINPRQLTVVGGRLYFRAADAAGDELWTSDGTAGGTFRIKDINAGAAASDPRGLTAFNGKLFFEASDGVSGRELWSSDGTEAGTLRVRDIAPGAGSASPTSLTDVNGTLFFTAQDGASGYELWKSDGTDAGTVRVRDIRPGAPGSSPMMLQNVQGKLMFLASDGVRGYEIWASDGTEAGTFNVADIIPGGGAPYIDNLRAAGGLLFFTADDGSGQELWKSDGTPAGTMRVKDIALGSSPSHPGSLTAIGSRIFFTANNGITGQELWTSDGTESGTMMLKDIRAGGGHGGLTALTASAGRLLFVADDGNGPALWKSDATAQGTTRVRQIEQISPGSASISGSINVNGTVFFAADDAIHGKELWRSDGTAEGTQMVIDTITGPAGSNPLALTNVGGALYFVTGTRLWKSDGTAGGTILMRTFSAAPTLLTAVGNTLYFVGADAAGRELWKSDGAAAGTVRVKDIFIGGSAAPESLVNVNGTLFFTANDGISGQELWKSDGTEAGTVRVRDIVAGAGSSGPLLLTNVNGTLFFRAGDELHGYELWKSDGTDAGTTLVKDIRPGADHSVVAFLTNVGGTLFFTANDGVHGQELWKSDGSATGTVMVRDIYPGPRGSSGGALADVNGTLFLRADNGALGSELWKSDGTETGTVLVKDVRSGPLSSAIILPVKANGRLTFIAHDGQHWKLWASDGSEAGTGVLATNSFPRNQVVLGDDLLFQAWSNPAGYELLRVSLSARLTASSATASEPAAAPDGPQALTAMTGGDVFYDATLNSDKPDVTGFGLPPISVSYRDHWVTVYDMEMADESLTRAAVQKAANLNRPLVFDIEHWHIDDRNNSEAQVQFNLERLAQVLDWARDERPEVSIGLYGIFPVGHYIAPTPASPIYSRWHQANQRLLPLAEKVDFIAPSLYTYFPRPDDWRAHAEATLSEGAMFAKPILPFLWMRYHQFDANVAGRNLPPQLWRMQLEIISHSADGAMLWDAGAPWLDNAPWWTLTRDFLLTPAPGAPAAPTALAASVDNAAARIRLTWKDNAYNETAHRVERRAAGDAQYTVVASLGANTTAWTDETATPGVQYDYRVVAVNAGGDSFASNEISTRIRIAPTAPTAVQAAAVSSTRIRIEWQTSSDDVESFIIERSSAGSSFAPIATRGAVQRSYEDINLQPGATYTYRVRAANAIGESAPSADVSATTPLNNGLRAHWRFDLKDPSVAIDSAGSYDGTLAGENGRPAGVSGTLGSALLFDAIDDRVVVPDAAGLRFGVADSFTLAAWVNLASLPNSARAIVAKARGSAAPYGIALDASNRWIATGASNLIGPAATTGWTHVVVVQDGAAGTRKLFVNGVEAASGAAQAADGAGALWIGAAEGAGEFFGGKIDDVRLYDRALSATHVSQLHVPNITINTSPADDDLWTIRLDAAGANYQFLNFDEIIFTRPIDTVGRIQVNGAAPADRLTVDFTNGHVVPLYGFHFDGGAGADTLAVIGAGPADPFTVNAADVRHNLLAVGHSGVEALDLSTGTFHVAANLGGKELHVRDGATVSIGATQRLARLNIDNADVALTPGGGKLIDADMLSITNGGALDVTDNDMILRGTTLATAEGFVREAYNYTEWDGSGVRTSRPAAAAGLTTVGLASAADIFGISGSESAQWNGQTVNATSVLVKYTYAGDANLDGIIDAGDYGIIDNFVQIAGASGYWRGDFNFDGFIDAGDYGIIDNNIQAQDLPL